MKRKYVATVHVEIWTEVEDQHISDLLAKETLKDASKSMSDHGIPHEVDCFEEIRYIETRRIPVCV